MRIQRFPVHHVVIIPNSKVSLNVNAQNVMLATAGLQQRCAALSAADYYSDLAQPM
jgi:hypothetical protein